MRVGAAVAIAGLLLTVVSGAIAGISGGRSPAVPTTTTAPASPGTTALAALLEDRLGARYHVVYDLATADVEGTATIEVWRDGDRVRTDTTVEAEDRSGSSSTFTGPGTARACTRAPGEDWSCQDVPEPERAALAELAGLLGPLEGIEVAEVVATDVAGRSARCFAATAGTVTVCVVPGGPVARIAGGGLVLAATSVDDDVPPGTFEPPG